MTESTNKKFVGCGNWFMLFYRETPPPPTSLSSVTFGSLVGISFSITIIDYRSLKKGYDRKSFLVNDQTISE